MSEINYFVMIFDFNDVIVGVVILLVGLDR